MLELTLFQSLGQLLIIGAIILFGQVVYSAVGFGSGMITITLLALLYGNLDLFVPFFLILCLPTELLITVKERKHLDFKVTWKLLFFILPSMVAGTFLLKKLPQRSLITLLGIIIMIVSVFILFLEPKINFKFNGFGQMAIIGSLSGILGAMYGISGPPLIVYFKSRKMDKSGFRVAMLSIFLVMSLLRLILYSLFGFYQLKILISLIPMIPFALSGLYLGNLIHGRIAEEPFKWITSIILFLSGLMLLISPY